MGFFKELLSDTKNELREQGVLKSTEEIADAAKELLRDMQECKQKDLCGNAADAGFTFRSIA